MLNDVNLESIETHASELRRELEKLKLTNSRQLEYIDLLEKQISASQKAIAAIREILRDLVFKWDARKREIPMFEKDWNAARREIKK